MLACACASVSCAFFFQVGLLVHHIPRDANEGKKQFSNRLSQQYDMEVSAPNGERERDSERERERERESMCVCVGRGRCSEGEVWQNCFSPALVTRMTVASLDR